MSHLKRAASGFGWNHIGRIVEYVLMFLFSVLVARTLGAETNGHFVTFLSVVQILLVISSFGLETSIAARLPGILREGSRESAVGSLRGLLIVRLGTIFMVVIVFSLTVSIFSRIFSFPPTFSSLLWLLLLFFGLRSIISLFTSFYVARLDTRTPALVAFGARSAELLAGIVLLGMGFGIHEIFVILVVVGGVQAVALVLLLRNEFVGPASWKEVQATIIMGGKFWVNGIFEFILGKQADILMLGYFAIGAIFIGYYDVAVSFAQVINFGMTAGLQGLSIAAFASAGSDAAYTKKYWEFVSRLVLFAVLPVFVFALVFADIVIPFVYSSQYTSSIVSFQIFAVFLILTRFVGGGTAADYLYAAGHAKVLVVASLVSGAVNMLLAFILIPRMGALGAIFATGIAALVIASVHGYYVSKFTGARLPVIEGMLIVAGAVISTLLVRAIVPGLLSDNIVILIILYTIFLGILFAILKPLQESDVSLLGEISQYFARLASPFAKTDRDEKEESVDVLTDRQKWAFGWLPSSGVLVDVGSSYSPLVARLHEKAVQAFAIEMDKEALHSIYSIAPNVHPIEASALKLPFSSASVDTVLLLDVIEHLENDVEAVREAERILRPGGKLILSVPHQGLFHFLDPLNIKSRRNSVQVKHRHYSESDLTRLIFLRFRVLKIHYGGLFLYPLTFAANHFVRKYLHRDLSKFFKKLGDLDNDISWGKWSYNVILLAEKI